MSVVVNDKPVDIPAGSSVSDLFSALSLSPQGFAVAINGQIVPRTQWLTRRSMKAIKSPCSRLLPEANHVTHCR